MKFYNREDELKDLNEIYIKSLDSSKMTIIMGRRRIGKTKLILRFSEQMRLNNDAFSFIYLFVSKKEEQLLCDDFSIIIQENLNVKIFGKINNFAALFEYLMELSKNRNITLVIDEFQEFFNINPSVFSEIQNIWDRYKDAAKMNLIFCGSMYSIMKKIFENAKEPLFGRANKKIILKHFNINVLKQILNDYNPSYSKKDLLSLYVFTGGTPRYLELFLDEKALNYKKMIDVIFKKDSFFLNEGKDLLIEEFGKEYVVYFSILSLMSNSKTSRGEIESYIGKEIGGYLNRLENDYNIIKKVKPIFAKEGSKTQKYFIDDNFLNFWFRFIFKYKSAIEIENFNYVKKIVERDFDTFSGKYLEKYFKEKLEISHKYSEIGSYWEKNNNNEIDIVAINKLEKKLLMAEVKINNNKINLEVLKNKSKRFFVKYPQFKDWDIEYAGFSLDDI
jgi:AAA+ ATPase superfamily predicted ATPase